MIAMLFFLIFGIIGVNFLKGLFYECEISKIKTLIGFDINNIDTKWDCFNCGGDWVK